MTNLKIAQASLRISIARSRPTLFAALCLMSGLFLLVAALLAGGVHEARTGTENTTVVAAGSPEGEIYTQHGCPDEVIPVGNRVGPNVKHWDKYVVVYRVHEDHRKFGFLGVDQRRSNISYLIEHGKVVNGGYVGGGSAKMVWQDRAGYSASVTRPTGLASGAARQRPVVSHSIAAQTGFGTQVTETLAPGASEGEILMKHGAPGRIVNLGTRWHNEATGEIANVDKYLFEYRIEKGSSRMGGLMARTRSYNICYLVERGRAMGGGFVASGSTTSFIGNATVRTRILLFIGGLVLIAIGVAFKPKNRRGALLAAALFTTLSVVLAVEVPVSLLLSTGIVVLYVSAVWESNEVH